MTDALQCPLCGQPLHLDGKSLVCAQRHAFDFAKEGSVHLLPQRLRSKATGDDKEMLQARRAFLDGSHYLPLQVALAAAVAEEVAEKTDPLVVDAGCGEGTYLGFVLEALRAKGARDATAIGFDVSGYAVKRAAARHKGETFAVADVSIGLPVLAKRAQVLLNIFAPRNPEDFARLLADDGTLVVVIPAAHHLAQLRAQVKMISIAEQKRERLETQLGTHFECFSVQPIEWTMRLEGADISHLVHMTPSHRHLSPEDAAALLQTPPLDVTASMELVRFRKKR